MSPNYETVIGLEIHIQLGTASKLFCGCANTPTEPNLELCPVCLGLPGALPVPNQEAITRTQRLGAAIGAPLEPSSRFDRKHYFYPDLPKGYQISQYEHPLASGGTVTIELEGKRRTIGIERIHLEEDAGKNIHRGRETVVDLGRAGTPLVELVTKPDLRSPAEARVFLQQLQALVRTLGVGEANMEKGELRVDANLSLRKPRAELGAKVEVKNMNSFRFMERALEFEASRQRSLLERGEAVVQETRGFVEKSGETVSQRTKEEAQDYRYLPEPDIPPLEFDEGELGRLTTEVQAELEARRSEQGREGEKRTELIRAGFMVGTGSAYLGDRVFAGLKEVQDLLNDPQIPKELDSLIPRSSEQAEIIRYLSEDAGERRTKLVTYLAEAIREQRAGKSFRQVSTALSAALQSWPESLADALEDLRYTEVDLGPIIDRILAEHPGAVTDYRAGNERALAALIGAIMKATEGRADPAGLSKILEEKLRK